MNHMGRRVPAWQASASRVPPKPKNKHRRAFTIVVEFRYAEVIPQKVQQ